MTTPELAVFVYGTLMRGEVNHPRFCAGAIAVQPATTLGRLFHLPAGYPAFAAEPSVVLAAGGGELDADLAMQQEWDARLRTEASEGWPEPRDLFRVHGEWMTFGDPPVRLPRIDALEGFRPGRPSLYQRVLVRCWVGDERTPRAAWTYVQPRPRGRAVPGGRWTPTAGIRAGEGG